MAKTNISGEFWTIVGAIAGVIGTLVAIVALVKPSNLYVVTPPVATEPINISSPLPSVATVAVATPTVVATPINTPASLPTVEAEPVPTPSTDPATKAGDDFATGVLEESLRWLMFF